MRIVSVDTETEKILPGLLTPPLACLTWTERVGAELPRNILAPEDGLEFFWQTIRDQDVCQCGSNLIYDLGVLVEACPEKHRAELLALIFRALRDGRISQTDTRESLLLLADGLLSWHPQENRKPGVGLGDVCKRRLGLDISADKKNPDAWRLRYGELVGVPLEFWPEDAVRYAVDDPRIDLLCWEHQLEEAQREGYTDPNLPWLVVDEGRKVATAWALQLCSIHGLRTDAERVAATSARIEQAGQAVEALLLATGLGEPKKKDGRAYVGQKRKVVQERVALVYAGIHTDPELLAELSAGDPEAEDEDVADLTPEQARQLEAIVESPDAVKLPALVLPEHLEPYSLSRLTWGAPKNPAQEQELQEHEGMLILGRGEDGGWSWGAPENHIHEEVLEKCRGQIVQKVDPVGGGVAYRDRKTGQLVTPTTTPSKSFPEGQVSWSREVLELSGDPLLQLVAALGRVTKLRTTYVPILSHGTRVPIQPRYWSPKESGRTSCSGPNVQNLPAFGGIRECLIARELKDFSRRYARHPGRCAILAADVDQAECVAWAQDCIERFGFSRLGEVLREGKDPHLWTAIHFPQLAGMTYEEAKRLKDAGDPFVKKMRQYAKSPGVFGWMGGMGAKTLAKAARGYGVETSVAQAQEVIDVLNEAFPEGRYAARWASDMCSGESTFTFVQRVSLRRRGGCGYTDGRNTVFQGGIADFAGDVLFHVAEECYLGRVTDGRDSWMDAGVELKHGLDQEMDLIRFGIMSPLYGARPWAFEHDGFLYEVPYDAWGPERSTLAAERLEQVIRERGAFWFPDVPTRSTAGIARRWIKDRARGVEIKQVRNSDEYIVPMDDVEEEKQKQITG